METDGRFMMDNNFRYSRILLGWAQQHRIPFLYASSAAVYGASKVFREERSAEAPLNIYGYSKFLFDQMVRPMLASSGGSGLSAPVVGFRYFNVYGMREQHKGRMASVAFHHFNQYLTHGRVKLFEGHDGWKAGEQERDFVSVEDVVKVNLHFLNKALAGQSTSGIFPDDLKGKYQSHTQADLTRLRGAGYRARFLSVQEGVSRYVNARLTAS